MQIVDRFKALASQGAALVVEIKQLGLPVAQLADVLDCSVTTASLLRSMGRSLSDAQLRLACEHGYSVDRLREIAGIPKRLKNPEVDRDALIREVIVDCAQFSHRELRVHVRRLIDACNDGFVAKRSWYVRFSKVADADGMKYMIAKMPAHVLERVRTSLVEPARGFAASGRACGEAEGFAMALVDRVCAAGDAFGMQVSSACECGAGCECGDVCGEQCECGCRVNDVDLRYRPCFLIPVGDGVGLAAGEVATSDGEVVDVRDVVDAAVGRFGFAVACMKDAAGVSRPVEVFGVKRLADGRDRLLTIIEHLVCQHGDCDIPAVRCDVHHIVAFSRGGVTVGENLCPLCRVHNLENDDDPDRERFGRVIRDRETGLVWYRDYLGRLRRNRHPAQVHNGAAVAARMLS